MKVFVELPSDPLVEFSYFCRAIAAAVCPTGEEGLEGIDCVTAKLVSWHDSIPESLPPVSSPYYRAWQSVLVDENGRTLDELFPTDRSIDAVDGAMELRLGGSSPAQIGEISLSVVLSEDDRHELTEVLRHLPNHVPALRYPMSEDERAVFLTAYCNMPSRPMWIPILATEETIEIRKANQNAELRRHQQALAQEFTAGRLTVVDARHAPVATLMAGTFIPRAQAIAYLERHGLGHRAAEMGDERHAAVPDKPQQDLGESDAEWRPGTRKLTPEQEEELLVYYEGLVDNNDRAFVKKTAEKFGLSRRHVGTVVERLRLERLARQHPRIDQVLAGTPR